MPSFALAGIARAAITKGNELRDKPVSEEVLRVLCSWFVNVGDPFVEDKNLRSFLARTGAEQLPYQALPFWDLARTRALLEDAATVTAQDVITPTLWHELLGCTLDQFVGVTLLLYASAQNNEGRFDHRWLQQNNFARILTHIPRDVIEQISRSAFIQSTDQYKVIDTEHAITTAGLERFSFNPLLVAPFVEIHGHVPIAPVARAVLFRGTPGSLYYTAVKRHGHRFTDALGRVFQTYVGSHLKLCAPEQLLPDIEYEPDKRAVDFIMVMPTAILLIEAKATRLTYESRLGGQCMDTDYARAPGKGMQQIETTAGLIRDRHPAFKDVPHDRRILGLVVTMEPYYAWANEVVIPHTEGSVPKWLASMRELEQLVSLEGIRLDDALTALAADSTERGVESILAKHKGGRNSILDAAWARYPFEGQGN